MKLICPECKNEVDLSSYTDLKNEDTVECNWCGITLMVNNVEKDELGAEIVDEGK